MSFMFCLLLVGGPGVSVAVKRCANTAADGVIKRQAVQSKRDSLQVCLSLSLSVWRAFKVYLF